VLIFGVIDELRTIRNAPTLGHVADVPPGLDSKSDLLESLAESLRFPSYFGHNWDALEDFLADLSWLPPGAVGIVHADLPLATHAADRDLYLDLLSSVEMAWPAKGRELVLVFPQPTAPYVRTFW
jgi:RNAse (barnase) inhibitor barstar